MWTRLRGAIVSDAFHKARHYKQGGGVALYVNDKIDCTLIESKSVIVENMFECVTVELNMRKMKNVVCQLHV